MNTHLQQLIDLSKIDSEIDAFEPQIEEARYKLEALYAKKKSVDTDIESLNDEIRQDEIKKRKNEIHLAELKQKLEDNSKKSSEVKTEREMKSLQLEEEIAKEQVAFANEEIERLEKIVDLKNEQIEAAKTSLTELDSSLADVQKEVDAKLEVINASRQEVFNKKEKLLAQMNQKGLSFYQKIRRWAKNTTVVSVEDQACMGCHLIINDKVYSDVIKGEEIVTCPHCGRILYNEAQTA